MKIKPKEQVRLRNIKGENVDVAPGETVEVNDDFGKHEIAAGRAESAEPVKKKEGDPAK